MPKVVTKKKKNKLRKPTTKYNNNNNNNNNDSFEDYDSPEISLNDDNIKFDFPDPDYQPGNFKQPARAFIIVYMSRISPKWC